LWPCNENYISLLKETKTVVLTEGVFDTIGCFLAGLNAMTTFGKHVTDKQLKLLKEAGIETVVLGWDDDAVREVVKTVDDLTTSGFNTKILSLGLSHEGEKVDLGDAVKDRTLLPSVTEAYNNAIDVHSSSYWEWRLRKELDE